MTPNKRIYSHQATGTGDEGRTGASTEIFPYWSFTKTVLAICTLRLVEKGKLDLDAQLSDHGFTLRQLLNHTAGLPDYHSLKEYREAVENDGEPWSRDRLFTATMAQGRLFPPGTGWSYSNLGYLLVRELLEDASGSPLSVAVREFVCDDLGLTSIELATTRQQFARVHWVGARRYHPGWVYHGCLTGTAADAAHLLHGLFMGRLLSAPMLDLMLNSRRLGGALDGRPWTECGYGLGVMSGRCGVAGRAIGHSGGGPFSVNTALHFPDLDEPVTVACFTNGRDEGVAEFAAVERAIGK